MQTLQYGFRMRGARAAVHRVALLAALLSGPGCDRTASPSGPTAPGRTRADVQRATVGTESRYVWTAANHRLALDIPKDARLEVGFGVSPTWPKELDAVNVSVGLDDRVVVQTRVERPPKDRNQWHDATVDLGALAGQRATLTLDASVTGAMAGAQIVWTTPQVVPAASAAATRPNVILISIDTLRADHLGCYGYARETSPNIDRMAGEGVVFSDLVASSSWTLPATISMLTGLDPPRHGRVAVGLPPQEPKLEMLADRMWELGYDTAAFVGGAFVAESMGFGQGFDRFWEVPDGGTGGDTLQRMVGESEPWMRARRGRPFFLFLHTYHVHLPFQPPPPYDTLFDPSYDGPYRTAFTIKDSMDLLKAKRGPFDPRILQHLAALYDGEIRDMDDAVGDLLRFLDASGLARDTCVLFTSDHGEEFGEHGGLHHHDAKLFQELIRVPLVVWCPSRVSGGRVVDGLASHADIVPTVLELAGGTAPEDIDGQSLFAVLQGRGHPSRTFALSEVDGSVARKTGTARSIRSARYKLITSSIDSSEQLFDLQTDPTETRNVGPAQIELAQELRAVAGPPGTAAVPATPAEAPDDATRERLRALGYVE